MSKRRNSPITKSTRPRTALMLERLEDRLAPAQLAHSTANLIDWNRPIIAPSAVAAPLAAANTQAGVASFQLSAFASLKLGDMQKDVSFNKSDNIAIKLSRNGEGSASLKLDQVVTLRVGNSVETVDFRVDGLVTIKRQGNDQVANIMVEGLSVTTLSIMDSPGTIAPTAITDILPEASLKLDGMVSLKLTDNPNVVTIKIQDSVGSLKLDPGERRADLNHDDLASFDWKVRGNTASVDLDGVAGLKVDSQPGPTAYQKHFEINNAMSSLHLDGNTDIKLGDTNTASILIGLLVPQGAANVTSEGTFSMGLGGSSDLASRKNYGFAQGAIKSFSEGILIGLLKDGGETSADFSHRLETAGVIAIIRIEDAASLMTGGGANAISHSDSFSAEGAISHAAGAIAGLIKSQVPIQLSTASKIAPAAIVLGVTRASAEPTQDLDIAGTLSSLKIDSATDIKLRGNADSASQGFHLSAKRLDGSFHFHRMGDVELGGDAASASHEAIFEPSSGGTHTGLKPAATPRNTLMARQTSIVVDLSTRLHLGASGDFASHDVGLDIKGMIDSLAYGDSVELVPAVNESHSGKKHHLEIMGNVTSWSLDSATVMSIGGGGDVASNEFHLTGQGRVSHLFADGSVRFLHDSIPPQLSTPSAATAAPQSVEHEEALDVDGDIASIKLDSATGLNMGGRGDMAMREFHFASKPIGRGLQLDNMDNAGQGLALPSALGDTFQFDSMDNLQLGVQKAVTYRSEVKHNGAAAFEIKDISFEVENKSTIGSATGGAGGGKIDNFKQLMEATGHRFNVEMDGTVELLPAVQREAASQQHHLGVTGKFESLRFTDMASLMIPNDQAVASRRLFLVLKGQMASFDFSSATTLTPNATRELASDEVHVLITPCIDAAGVADEVSLTFAEVVDLMVGDLETMARHIRMLTSDMPISVDFTDVLLRPVVTGGT